MASDLATKRPVVGSLKLTVCSPDEIPPLPSRNDHARKLVRVEITIGPRSLENIGAFEVAAKGSDGDGSDHVGCLTGGRERHNVDVQTVPGKACGWRVSCSLAAGGMLSTELTAVPRDRAGYRPAHSELLGSLLTTAVRLVVVSIRIVPAGAAEKRWRYLAAAAVAVLHIESTSAVASCEC